MLKSIKLFAFFASAFLLFLICLAATADIKPSLSSLRRAYEGLGDDEDFE